MKPGRIALVFLAGSIALSGCIGGLFALGVGLEAKRQAGFCELPCRARQTCSVAFDPRDVCDVIVSMRADWQQRYGGYPHDDTAGLTVEWVPGEEGTRAFLDEYGRAVAGVTRGALEVQVAYLPTDHPRQTALRHEMGHVLLMGRFGSYDHDHTRVEWRWIDR